MCGIAGVFKPQGAFDAARVERDLESSLEAQAHRGPDARSIKILPDRGLALGHLRLSIIDLSERANQPMSSVGGKTWIVFNGEIYNFEQIREELEGLGHTFATLSDTEVLLHGYRRWGMAGLLARAAGMFAFALYDDAQKKLFLARDRAGEKPLYYAERDGGVYFASELAGLLAIWPGPKVLSRDGLEAFMELKFVPSPDTLIEEFQKVEPGCWLEFSSGQSKTHQYWSALSPAGSFHGDAADRVDAALSTAARRCLVSDVPVCVFLSGGIDSSLIVSKIAEAGARGTAAYTVGYSDLPGYNEFEYSRMIAKAFPVEPREVLISSKDVLAALEDDALVLSDPITDWVWVPLHFLSRRAREDGFKVVLTGEGSDELFFGYDSMQQGLADIDFYSNPLARLGARTLSALGKPVFAATRRGHQRYERWRRAGHGLPVYWGSSLGFPPSLYDRWAGPSAGDEHAGCAQDFITYLAKSYRRVAADRGDRINWICYVEFWTKMSEVLLSRVDRVTMLSSLESRAPFLDRDLAELAFSIPGPAKLPGGRLKGLLKDVARRQLPPEVIDRKKMGFSFPFKEWLRGPLGPAVESVFKDGRLFKDGWVNPEFCAALLREHRGGVVDHAPRLWMLYSLARWYDRWL